MVLNKKITTAELQETLKIGKSTWKRRREEILKFLEEFYEYEVIEGHRTICFNFTKELKPWTGLPRKTNLKEKEDFYKEETSKLIKKMPRNTGSNIARNIEATNNKYSHAEGTIGNYVRSCLRKHYEPEDRQWCFLSTDKLTYEPLTEEQSMYLKECFDIFYNGDLSTAEIMSDYKAGTITRAEMKEKLVEAVERPYENAICRFRDKYSKYPLNVPIWVEGINFSELPQEPFTFE